MAKIKSINSGGLISKLVLPLNLFMGTLNKMVSTVVLAKVGCGEGGVVQAKVGCGEGGVVLAKVGCGEGGASGRNERIGDRSSPDYQ